MTMAPTERHIHVDLDVDREHHFHYRTQGREGRRVVLHRGDIVTFTCNDDFMIEFVGPSPFEEAVLHSRHACITAHVRPDAPCAPYHYAVEVERENELVTDPTSGVASETGPQIVVESPS